MQSSSNSAITSENSSALVKKRLREDEIKKIAEKEDAIHALIKMLEDYQLNTYVRQNPERDLTDLMVKVTRQLYRILKESILLPKLELILRQLNTSEGISNIISRLKNLTIMIFLIDNKIRIDTLLLMSDNRFTNLINPYFTEKLNAHLYGQQHTIEDILNKEGDIFFTSQPCTNQDDNKTHSYKRQKLNYEPGPGPVFTNRKRRLAFDGGREGDGNAAPAPALAAQATPASIDIMTAQSNSDNTVVAAADDVRPVSTEPAPLYRPS